MQLCLAKYTLSILTTIVAISGCALNGDTSPSRGSSDHGTGVYGNPNIRYSAPANLPDVSKKSLSMEENLPGKPVSGRAFLGIRVSDCPASATLGIGTYVIGYFTFNEKSPSRDAGIKIGDKVLSINSREGVNESNFTTYISSVAKTASYTIKIQRKTGNYIVDHEFTVLSFGLPDWCISSDRRQPCLNKPGLERENACEKL